MARTNIPVQSIAGYGVTINSLTFTNSDQANDMYFLNDGNTVLIARTVSGATQTVTLPGVTDKNGRTRAPTIVTVANGVGMTGILPPEFFNSTTAGEENWCKVDIATDTGLSFAAVQLQR